MEYQQIIYRKEAGVATLVFNRPRSLNALDEPTLDEIQDALKKTAADAEVRVLILTGAGRAFCFGADVSEFHKAQEGNGVETLMALLSKAQGIIQLLSGMPKPTIAALNGFASGLGLDFALACDIRVAADRAKVSEAFVSMGLVPDGGGTFFLPRLVGSGKAAELIFTGAPLSSGEAERIGLINRVVPSADFESFVRQFAQKLAKGPPLAIRLAKQALKRNSQGTLSDALKLEAEFQKLCLLSADHREAVHSFLERREPVFQNK